MTHLNWIKGRNKASPLFASQIDGLTVLLGIGVLLYFYMATFYWDNPRDIMVPFADRKEGTIPVELAGAVKHPGIYYLPADATLASFYRILNLPLPTNGPDHLVNRRLNPGETIIIEQDRSIRFAVMPPAKRLALHLHLDINTATMEDLILIPGVKEATAVKILSYRQAAGGRIARMEELLQVPGIKEKRLQVLKKYLYIPDEYDPQGSMRVKTGGNIHLPNP